MARYNPFPLAGSSVEIDLRKELNRTMFGAGDEIKKGAINILRRMRRKESLRLPNGMYKMPVSSRDLERCPCVTETVHHEPNKEYPCPECFGEGYLFDDEIVTAYKTNKFEYTDTERNKPWGKNIVSMSFFYVEYYKNISRFDKIIEPLHDLEGRIISPMSVLHTHNIHMAEEFRSDRGRTEYWRLACFTD